MLFAHITVVARKGNRIAYEKILKEYHLLNFTQNKEYQDFHSEMKPLIFQNKNKTIFILIYTSTVTEKIKVGLIYYGVKTKFQTPLTSISTVVWITCVI